VIATRIIANTKTKATKQIQTADLPTSGRRKWKELTTTPGRPYPKLSIRLSLDFFHALSLPC
jgi:hypothetical protein